MSAAAVLHRLAVHGTSLEAAGSQLRAVGQPLTPELRAEVLSCKGELLRLLAANEPHPSLEQLLAAAELACTAWNDDAAARRQMRDDCVGIPPEHRREWINHFRTAYGDNK